MKKRKKKEEKKEKKYPVINGIIFLRPEVLEEDIRALPGLGVDSIDDGVQRQVQLLQCGYHRDFWIRERNKRMRMNEKIRGD